jgi:hypothetical protein
MLVSEDEDNKNLTGVKMLIFGYESTVKKEHFDDIMETQPLRWMFNATLIRERACNFISPFNLKRLEEE